MKKLFLIACSFFIMGVKANAVSLFKATLTITNQNFSGYKKSIRALDGGTAIHGISYDINGNNAYFILKLDSSGNTMWTKFFGLNQTGGYYQSCLQQTPDSGFFFGWDGPNSPMGGYCKGFTINRLDKNGNIIFSKEKITSNDFTFLTMRNLYVVPGTDTAVYIESLSSNSSSYLNKISSTGTVTNLSYARDNLNGHSYYNFSVISNGGVPDGYLAMGNAASLIRLGVSGNVIWSRNYPNANFSNVLLLGNYYYAVSDNNLIKLDLSGNVVTARQFPGPIMSLSANGPGKILLAGAIGNNYCMMEMDTTFGIIRTKVSSDIAADLFNLYGANVDPQTKEFRFLGADDVTITFEKATIDSSCSFHDTTITTSIITFTSTAYGNATTFTASIDPGNDIATIITSTSTTSCSISYTPPAPKTVFKAFIPTNRLASTIPTKDGGSISVGDDGANNGCLLMKLDNHGNVLWSKNYYSGFTYGAVLKSFVVELPDSSLYLGINGPVDQGVVGNNTRYIFYRLSSNGTILYSYQSDIHGGEDSGQILSDMKLIPNTDTLVYVIRYYDDLNNSYNSSLCKMGPNGVETVISEKGQPSPSGYVFYTVTPVTNAGAADGFIVTTASTAQAPNQTGLMKINNNGTVAWQIQLSGASVVSGVTQLGNEYYAVGTGFSGGNPAGYFYKLSSTGSLLLSTISGNVPYGNTVLYEEQNSFSAVGNSHLVNAYNSVVGKPLAIEFDLSGNITRAKTASYSGDYTISGIDPVNEELYFTSIPNSLPDLTFEKMSFTNSCSFYDTTLNTVPYAATAGSFTLPFTPLNDTTQFTAGPPTPINLGLTSVVNCLDTNGCTLPIALINAGGATTFCPGDSVLLTATAGTGYTYQWKKNNVTIAGQTNATYYANTSGTYLCEVTNSCNTILSNTLTITVSSTPVTAITAGGPTSFCSGSNVLLTANTALGYQWKLNGSNIGGATSQTYTATATGSYTCSITQSCGTGTSNAIGINVIIPPTASITAGGVTTFCSGLSVTLSAATASGYSYQWQLNSVNIAGQTSANYVANASGNYTCVVTNTCGVSTSNSIAVSVLPLPATPLITPGGSSTVCSGQSITFITPLVVGYTYQWKRNATVLGTTTNSLTTATAGTYTVIVNNGTCPSLPSTGSVLTVNPQPTATITPATPTTVCAGGGVVLNANTGTGLTYQWQKTSVNIGGATSATYIATTAGSYRVMVTNANGCTKISNAIAAAFTGTSVTAGITVTGPTTFCVGAGTFLKETTSIPGYGYQWKLNGATIAGAIADSYVPIASGNYTVTVTAACGSATSAIQSITVNPTPSVSITAPNGTVLCPAPTLELDATGTNIVSYQWQLNGSNISGATAAIYNASLAGNYTCIVTNACGTATSNVIVLTGGGTPPVATITANGPTTFCDTDSLLLSAQTGTGYNYQWQLNGSPVNGATNSDYMVFASGNYACVVTAACGSATSNIITTTVNITPAQPGTVTSISQACNPVNNVPVSISAVPGATSYHWYAVNPTITFNGPVDGLTASVNLLPSTNSGYNIWVEAINNGCVSQPRVKFIRRSLSVPASVIGGTQVCVPQTGVSYSCAAITGADDYLWTVPAGVSITSGQGTNAIVVSFAGNYTTGSICVSARLNCGFATVPKCKTVISIGNSTLPITNLTGPTYLCPGNSYNYSVTNISGATFNWTVPANVNIIGQGTNAITVTPQAGFSSGSICVNATSGCATSLTKCTGVATSTPGRPSGIAGILNGVCATSQSYTAASVSGATGYNWTVTGGTILTGQGTQTISVQWNSTGTSGILEVAAVNGCGTGLVRSVGITLKPETAAAISGPAALCAGSVNNMFSIPVANGASTYIWQITPAGSNIVSGQGSTSISATWGSSSGTVLCTPSNACGTSKTKTFTVTVNCRIGNGEVADETASMELTAYPNPFNGKINLLLNSSNDATVNIKVTDIAGRIISEQFINANTVYSLGEYLPGGIYFVAAKQNDTVKTIRIVKNQ